MSVTYKALNKSISIRLEQMLDRNRSIRTVMLRNVYPLYQNVQRKRWMTENQSEGKAWKRLNPNYEEAKKKRFKDYPGRGRKMLIATNTLAPSVIGPSPYHHVVVLNRGLKIVTTLPYAKDVNDVRPFDTYSPETRKRFRDLIKNYIIKNTLRNW